MGLYGRDENMMSDFFTNLGGSNTLSIIDRIGADASKGRSEEENLLLGQQIRDGLSRGSSDWDSATAEKFADDMFNGDQEYWLDAGIHNGNTVYGRPEAIAWLFSSPDKNPMGAELSLASALQIDQYERENGGKPWGDFAYATGGPNGAALWMLENPGAEGYHAIDDTASLIFQNLALYVDHTIDFLDPESGEGEDRVAYWFGDRDWSQSDGFEGPGELWFTAQHIDGGPFSANPTEEGMTWAADLTSRIMFELGDNASFLPESLSDEGAAVLANNLAPHLSGIADYIFRHVTPEPTDAGVWSNEIFGSDGEVILPIVNQDLISKLFGTIGSNDVGAQYIGNNLMELQELYMTGPMPEGSTIEDSIERVIKVQGAIDGSGIGARLAEATIKDDAKSAQIDTIMSAVNLIPIPGASKLFVDGGVKLIDKIQALAVKEVKGGLVDAWKESVHVYDDLKLESQNLEETQKAMNQVKASTLIYEAFSEELAAVSGPPPVREAGEDDASFWARSLTWSSDTADDMAKVTGADPLSLQVDYSNAHTAYNSRAEDYGK